VLLAGTAGGLALTYLAAPLLAMFGTGIERWAGALAWVVMAILFQPMLHLYRRSPLWGLALPLIAIFYGGATLWSAWQYHRGRGGQWKGRVQAALQ
jgi:TctA family transporter